MNKDKIRIQKNSVQETLVIPLYARKLCSEMFPSLYQDPGSVRLVDRLDYDFSVMRKKTDSFIGRFGALEIAMRQSDLAYEVRDYVKKHPGASIVNLGCGLDQTAENCDDGTCKIYNLDFEEVIAVRNELIPPNDNVYNIAVNLNDTVWFDKIDASNGVIFMAAGVFYYFQFEQVKKLFQEMEKHFPGSVLVFDTAGKKAVKLMIKTWVKEAKIKDVNAYFYVNDIKDNLLKWLKQSRVTYRGYMLGYHDLKDPSVKLPYRLLAKVGDGYMKMKIVKIEFQSN